MQFKLVCTGSVNVSLDITESTKAKVMGATIPRDLVKAEGEAINRTLGTCTFHRVVSASKRINMDSEKGQEIFKRGCNNKVDFQHLTEADYAIVASCQLGMISHTVYKTVFQSGLLQQTVLKEPQFYACSTKLYDRVKLNNAFDEQSKLLKSIFRDVSGLKQSVEFLGMDTTFSQRRNANFSLTLLICVLSGIVFDFECLGKVESGLDPSKLEGKASEDLVRRVLNDLRTKKGPKIKGICTDGHVENASMMKELFYEFNKENSTKAVFVGPTKCNTYLEACVKAHVDEGKALCGVHAEAINSFGGTYRMEVQGQEKICSREEILEFLLPPGDFPKPGDQVHIAKSVNTLLRHLLDLWHLRNTLREALNTKIGFLPEDVSQFHQGFCQRHFQDVLTEIINSDTLDLTLDRDLP